MKLKILKNTHEFYLSTIIYNIDENQVTNFYISDGVYYNQTTTIKTKTKWSQL